MSRMNEDPAHPITLSAPVAEQIRALSAQLGMSNDALLTQALVVFVTMQHPQATNRAARPIQRGELYWLQVPAPDGPSIPHPHVVLQADALNQSRIATTVVCSLTSNLKRVSSPGNVLLEPDEARLPKQSVVEVAKVSLVGKSQLGAYIGTLSERRIEQIFAGMRLLQRSYF